MFLNQIKETHSSLSKITSVAVMTASWANVCMQVAVLTPVKMQTFKQLKH